MVTHSNILAWRIPMNRGSWWAIVHRVAKNWTWLKWLSTHAQFVSANSKLLIHPSPSSPFGNHKFVFYVCFCFINKFICTINLIPHIRDIIQYLSFSLWLTSLSMIISRSLHVAANGITSSFYDWVVFHCIFVLHLLYPSICGWTFRLLSCLICYK